MPGRGIKDSIHERFRQLFQSKFLSLTKTHFAASLLIDNKRMNDKTLVFRARGIRIGKAVSGSSCMLWALPRSYARSRL